MAWQTLSLLLCCCQNDCVELSVTQKCEQAPTTSRNEAAAALKEKKKGGGEEREIRSMQPYTNGTPSDTLRLTPTLVCQNRKTHY